MNYLAHLFLSESGDEALLGSLLGDFVKGDDYKCYNTGIREAILIHRGIDAYSNTHPVYCRSKRRISSSYRHTKAILVDVLYDHFLASDWGDYAEESLEDFSCRIYRILKTHQDMLPLRLKAILPRMVVNDWLRSYRDEVNIGLVLKGLSRRLSHDNRLYRGMEELHGNYEELRGDFRAFFPELVNHVSVLRDSLSRAERG